MVSVGVLSLACSFALCITPARAGCQQWVFAKQEQSCDDACSDAGGECPPNFESLKSAVEFQAILPHMFPETSQPCKQIMPGESPYDPSITDEYCGWQADSTKPGGVTSHAFQCAIAAPIGTRRFCPCSGLPTVAAEDCSVVEAENLKRANSDAYAAWKSGSPMAAATVTGEGISAASATPDLVVGTSGKDTYSIVNKANDRALYALAAPAEGTTGKDGLGVGARIGMTGSPAQNFHIVMQSPATSTEPAKYFIINADTKRRIYAENGADYDEGFGATNAESESLDQFWYVMEMKGGGGDSHTDFVFMNAASNRYLYANAGRQEEAMGACADPQGNHIRWQLRVQSRVPVDGAIFQIFTSSSAEDYCADSPEDTITCTETGRPTDFARFELKMVDSSVPSFALKNVGKNKYCSDMEEGVECNVDAVTTFETFSLVKDLDGQSVSLFGGRGSYCTDTPHLQCNSAVVPDGSAKFSLRCIENCPLVNSIVPRPGSAGTRLYSENSLRPSSLTTSSGALLLFTCVGLFALGAVARRCSKGDSFTALEGQDALVLEDGSSDLVE